MKFALPLQLATLATAAFSSLIALNLPVKAAGFEEQAMDQNQVIAVARPYGEGKFDLLVIEQIPGKQPCWSESGSNPALIDPLLLNFDFTGICRRATDSNGYSIRLDGQDLGLDYLLRVVSRNGELMLVGTARTGNYPEIIVGRTGGLASGFMKINLNPGWQFAKRAYQGKVLGHYYLSASRTALAGDSETTTAAVPTTTETPAFPTTATEEEVAVKSRTAAKGDFSDLSNNTYKPEIEEAMEMGFVSGFEDGTFRPQEFVTREQLISMAVDAINTVYQVDLDAKPQRTVIPFKDVEASRWSAKKIAWAQWNFITIGNPNNTLQPTEPIARAELIDTMRRIAAHLKTRLNLPAEIEQTQVPAKFSDISGSWAETVITQMSGYCGVATPLNDEGTVFAPEKKATRDYATAALARTLKCVQMEEKAAQAKN